MYVLPINRKLNHIKTGSAYVVCMNGHHRLDRLCHYSDKDSVSRNGVTLTGPQSKTFEIESGAVLRKAPLYSIGRKRVSMTEYSDHFNNNEKKTSNARTELDESSVGQINRQTDIDLNTV